MNGTTPPDGLYYGIPDAEYRTWEAMSQSRLRYLIPPSTPRHFRHHEDHPAPPTTAQQAGSLIDCLLLEPEEFERRYTQRPQWPNAPCECGAVPGGPCLSVDKRSPGKPISKIHTGRWDAHVPTGIEITTAQRTHAEAVVREILDHPTAGDLIRESRHQVSMIWTDLETGARVKARPDIELHGLADLKKTRPGCASVERWMWEVDRWGLQVQAAMYLEGYAILTGQTDARWTWLAVETDQSGRHPTMIGLHEATDAMLEAGSREWHAALRLWCECKETGTWPGYPQHPQLCQPTPRMLRGKLEAEQRDASALCSTDASWLDEEEDSDE